MMTLKKNIASQLGFVITAQHQDILSLRVRFPVSSPLGRGGRPRCKSRASQSGHKAFLSCYCRVWTNRGFKARGNSVLSEGKQEVSCVCVWAAVSERRADGVIACVSADTVKPVGTLFSLQGQFHCTVLPGYIRNEWKWLKFFFFSSPESGPRVIHVSHLERLLNGLVVSMATTKRERERERESGKRSRAHSILESRECERRSGIREASCRRGHIGSPSSSPESEGAL